MRWSRRHLFGGSRVANASSDTTEDPIGQPRASVPPAEILPGTRPELGVDDGPIPASARVARRTPDRGRLAGRYLPGHYLG